MKWYMIIKEMFYIPIKLKPELARASTSALHTKCASVHAFTASDKMEFGPRFYTPIKLQTNAFNS